MGFTLTTLLLVFLFIAIVWSTIDTQSKMRTVSTMVAYAAPYSDTIFLFNIVLHVSLLGRGGGDASLVSPLRSYLGGLRSHLGSSIVTPK